METFCVPTISRIIRTYFLLSLVLACHALRVPSSSVPQNDDSFSVEGSDFLRLKSSSSSGDFVPHSKWDALKTYLFQEALTECEETYGIFPCSTSLGGNIVLLLVYGFCLLKAASFLSQGSELLLTVLNPGLIGGLLLPILGATPDALLILVSGVSASDAEAQAQVLVGMGLLAGSTIMLLTLLWGSSLIAGRCDLGPSAYGVEKVAKDRTLNNGWSLTETGVTTDQQTKVSSWIMMITVLPYLIAQSPVIFGWSVETGRITELVSCVLALIGLASYSTYQVAFPWIQQRWIYRARQKCRRSRFLCSISSYAHNHTLGSLLQEDGRTPNTTVLYRLFDKFDTNNDRSLSVDEVRGLIVGLGMESGLSAAEEDTVNVWMTELDVHKNGKMTQEEFVTGMKNWISSFNLPQQKPMRRPTMKRTDTLGASETNGGSEHDGPHFFLGPQREAENSYNALLRDQKYSDDEESDDETNAPTKGGIIFRAVLYLIAGAVIAGIMADPLVGAIGNFSKKSGISPFFISFVATPMATNSSEAISSILFALKKKKKNISMTYSQIYGGVTMNNTMCLAIFLGVVYYRGLTWDFSSEVLVIIIATVVIGILASVRVTFPLWMALIALALYPLSIALVAVLDSVYGWQ